MRLAVLLAVFAALFSAAQLGAQGRGRGHDREQDAAYHGMQQGHILPLPVILSRVRVRGARYIGADLDASGSVYRLTFMANDGTVIRLHVNARTGQPLGPAR